MPTTTVSSAFGRISSRIRADLEARGIRADGATGEPLRRMEQEAFDAYRKSCAEKTGVPQYFRSAEVEPGKLSEYLLRRTRTGRSTYVCGRAGTWKTYSACAMVNALCDEGMHDVLFTTAQRFMEAHDAVKRGDSMPLRAIEGAKVLVFDDLDKIDLEGGFGTRLSQLFSLEDARQGMTTVWTSNLTYADLGLRIASIKAGHADAIVRRLQEQCGAEIIAERESWHQRKAGQ